MKPNKDDMSDELRPRAELWEKLMDAAGLKWDYTSILRTGLEQIAYACQGRSTTEMIQFFTDHDRADICARIQAMRKNALQICNLFRTEAELKIITNADWYVITWTLKSRHLPDPQGKSNAFDFAIITNGTETWSPKVDSNKTGGPDYDEAGRLMKQAGLTWGGLFKDKNGDPSPDRPHGQV